MALQPRLHWITSSDSLLQLAVHEYDALGPPCLLLHGNGLSGRTFEAVSRRLVAGGLRVYAVDFRGHGCSVPLPQGDLHWPRFAADVLAVQDALHLHSCFAFGHSLGGAALLLAEASRPGSFAALYLYEPVVAPNAVPGAAAHPWDARMVPLISGARRRRRAFASRDEALAAYAAKPPFSHLRRDCLSAYVQHGFRPTPTGTGVELACAPETEAAIFEQGPRAGILPLRPRVRCRVTVAVGGRDAADGPAQAAPGVCAGCRDVRLETFPEVGHLGPLEAPELLGERALRTFLPQARL